MAIHQITVAALAIELSRLMGDLVVEGTATGGDSNTLIDTGRLTQLANDDVKAFWLAIHSGAAIGDERNVLSSSASADSVDSDANFSATIDTSSKYLITRTWRPQSYIDAIAGAVRRVQHTHLLPLDDVDGNLHELITLNDILSTDGNRNGQMEKWASGSTAAPDGWTLYNSTLGRDSDTNDVRRGKYSATLTSNGSAKGGLLQDIKHFERYAGKTVTLRAWHKSNTASRGSIILSDGVTSSSTAQTANANIWEELELEFTLSDDPTQLQIDLDTSAGGAVVTSWDNVRLISEGVAIYSYDLPERSMFLSEVRQALGSGALGTQSEEAYSQPMEQRSYYIEQGASPQLCFNSAYYTPSNDTPLRLTGQVHPAAITSATPATAWAETVEVNPEYVKMYGRWYLLNSLAPEEFTEQWRLAIRASREDWVAAESDLGSRPRPNSKVVQVL